MIAPRGGDPANGYVGGLAGFGLELLYAKGSAWARARAQSAPPVRAAVPVVSVGNLAVGGSGKTPCTVWLARLLSARGRRVVVVARPVGGEVPGGEGDEIAYLRGELPGVRVVATRDKAQAAFEAGRELAAAGGPAAIVVDDAFSHVRLARDLDLVLLDAGRPLGNGHLLPYGPLREPPSALRRAGAIVLTRADRLDDALRARTREAIATIAPGVPMAEARLAPVGLVRAHDGVPVAVVPGLRCVCMSGLARPHDLAASARALGLDVVGEVSHADHHRFRPSEWAGARARAEESGALLVVSAKDAARLDRARREQAHVLAVRWEWMSGEEAITRAVATALGGER